MRVAMKAVEESTRIIQAGSDPAMVPA